MIEAHPHGLSNETLEKLRQVLARWPQVRKAVLYGSRAKGNPRPGSDIDLALVGDALDDHQLAQIADAMDDLLLPYQIDLAIVSRIEHRDLRDHIARVGVTIYECAAEHKT